MRSLAIGSVLLAFLSEPGLAQQQPQRCPPSMPYRVCIIDQQVLPGSSPVSCPAGGTVPNQRCWCPNNKSPGARPYPGRVQCQLRNPQ